MLLTENELRDYIKIIIESNEVGIHKAISDEELNQIKTGGRFTRLLKKIGLATTGLVTIAMLNSAINLDNSINNEKVSIEKVVDFRDATRNLNSPVLTSKINDIEEEILKLPEFEYEKLSYDKLKQEIKKSEGFKEYPYEDGNGLSVGYGTQFIYNSHKIPSNWKEILYKKHNLNYSKSDKKNNKISKEIADKCFLNGFNSSVENLNKKFKDFDDLPQLWKEVLIDLNYNVGDSFDSKFPKFTEYTQLFIEAKDLKNISDMKKYASLAHEELSEVNSPKYHYQQSGGRSGYIKDDKGNITYGSPEGKKELDGPHRALKNYNKMKKMLDNNNLNESKSLKLVYSNLFS